MVALCPPLRLGALFVSIRLDTHWLLRVPLTQLTWNSWPVLPRMLAVEALTDQTELRAPICHTRPFCSITSHVSDFLK